MSQKRRYEEAAEAIAKAMNALCEVPYDDPLCMDGIAVLFDDMRALFRTFDGWYERQMELASGTDDDEP